MKTTGEEAAAVAGEAVAEDGEEVAAVGEAVVADGEEAVVQSLENILEEYVWRRSLYSTYVHVPRYVYVFNIGVVLYVD